MTYILKYLIIHKFMNFGEEFYKKIGNNKLTWLVRGILSTDDLVYGIGTDSKILSRVFELLSYPFIEEIAQEQNYYLEISSEQTVYPDFTLYKTKKDKTKLAIDIKSTYRKKPNAKFGFTLGSYTSFLRNNTKNIMYPYDEYSEHWIIGFVYDRETESSRSTKKVNLSERNTLMPSYKNVEFVVQEKYKIAGCKPGSGNTANIGSILGDLNDFKHGNGPFSSYGEATFRDYWANYGKNIPRPYSDLEGYFRWKKNQKNSFS